MCIWAFYSWRSDSPEVARADPAAGRLFSRSAAGQKWKFKTGTGDSAYVDTSPVIFEGVVYFGCGNGYLYALK